MATCDPSTSTKIRKSFNTLEETPGMLLLDVCVCVNDSHHYTHVYACVICVLQ